MGEKIGSIRDVRPTQIEGTGVVNAEEIARQLKDSTPVADTKDRGPSNIDAFGDLKDRKE